jgi:pimeloyl-ACP methyl ester carboxylesterase
MARLHGIGTDPITGDLYIGDSETHKVRKVSGLPGPGKNPPLSAYETANFEVAGRACKLTKPRSAAPGKPWIWRCRFYGAFPNVDEALLAAGWHIAWIDVANLFGAEAAMEAFGEFYAAIVKRGKLNDRPVMEGFSRGGLPAMNWAIRHPDKVSGVYLDAPVLDIHTWPKKTSPNLWKPCMEVYGLTEETAGDWRGPLDNFAPLVENKIPIFIVAGGNDAPVPWSKNGSILEKRVTESGGDISVIVKAACGHHPHSLHDTAPVVEWAKRVVLK